MHMRLGYYKHFVFVDDKSNKKLVRTK